VGEGRGACEIHSPIVPPSRCFGAAGLVETWVNSAGTSGSSGDGGAAVFARLNAQEGMTVWGGRLVICDRNNHRLRSVDLATRIITTLGGDGTAGTSGAGGDVSAARFNEPFSLSVLPDGSLVVVDHGGCMARRITAGGVVQSFLGTGTCSTTGNGGSAISATVNGPIGVAWENTTGVLNVYVGEYQGTRVSVRWELWQRATHLRIGGIARPLATGKHLLPPPSPLAPYCRAGSGRAVGCGLRVAAADGVAQPHRHAVDHPVHHTHGNAHAVQQPRLRMLGASRCR
jgi:hypothetical protein